MGASSQTAQLAVDLGTVPSDSLVWIPSGIDIFIDLDIRFTDLVAIQTSAPSVEDTGGNCQEVLDVQSEPFTSNLDFDSSHVDEPSLLEGIHRSCELQYDVWGVSCAAEGESGPSRDTNCENTAQVSAENCRTSDTDYENPVNAPSEVATTDDSEGDSASTFCSKGDTNGSAGNTPIAVSASTVFGIEGLDVDDISAACQLLELGLEDLEEGEDEVGNDTLAASRLFELSVSCSCDETDEEEFERHSGVYRDDYRDRSASAELSAPEDPFCTDLTFSGDDSEHCQEMFDSWSAHDISVDVSSDLRTLKLKRIKLNRGSPYRGSENDEDLDILDRPPHKRQYKSLRQLEATM